MDEGLLQKYLEMFGEEGKKHEDRIRTLLAPVTNADQILDNLINDENRRSPANFVIWLEAGIKKQMTEQKAEPVSEAKKPAMNDERVSEALDNYLALFPYIAKGQRAQLRLLVNEKDSDQVVGILETAALYTGLPEDVITQLQEVPLRQQESEPQETSTEMVDETLENPGKNVSSNTDSQPPENDVKPRGLAGLFRGHNSNRKNQARKNRTNRPNNSEKSRIPWMWIGIGILVLALIGGGVYYATMVPHPQRAQESEFQQPAAEVEAPPVVNLQAVDYKSVAFVGITLVFMLIAGAALIPLGILDAKERLQVSDITVALVGLLANYLAIWKPFVAFWTTLVPMFNEQSTAVTFGLLITGIVITKAVTGGRDTTNLGVYFGGLAIIGASFGNMGAFQAAFNIPYQPVYMLTGLPTAIIAKQTNAIQFSLLVYSILFLAIGAYLLDIVYPREKKPRYGAFFSFAAVVGIYYLALLKFDAQYALFFGISAGVVAAVLARKAGTTETSGENKLTKIVQRIFEYTPWDGACLGIVVLVLLRLAGVA